MYHKITFKSLRSGRMIECTGELIPELNRTESDRYILRKQDGSYEDIYKQTVESIEEIKK